MPNVVARGNHRDARRETVRTRAIAMRERMRACIVALMRCGDAARRALTREFNKSSTSSLGE
jgi:hypothetical protein